MSRGLQNDIEDRADETDPNDEDETFQSVNAPPSGIARPRQRKAAEEPVDMNTGIFNPTIGAPSPSVAAAMAIPEAERSLAQKKLLADRRGTEALATDRGGSVRNPVTQGLNDEKTVVAAKAAGAFNKRVEDSYNSGYNPNAAGAAPGATGTTPNATAPVAATTVSTPNATAAKVITPPWDDPNNPANHRAATLGATAPANPAPSLGGRGYAMRTMDDGTVKVASGVGTGALRNQSNEYSFASEAAAKDVFRPTKAPTPSVPAPATGPGAGPQQASAPTTAAGAGLQVAQMAMGSPPINGPGITPAPTRNPVLPRGPVTPPWDNPSNPANRQAATLASSMPSAATPPVRERRPHPVEELAANTARAAGRGVVAPVKSAVSALTPNPEDVDPNADKLWSGLRGPMGPTYGNNKRKPMQSPAAARTTSPTTSLNMRMKTGANLDPFRRY